MRVLSNLKEKAQHRREEEVKEMASDFITLADFDNQVFIAFQGSPLLLLDESLTIKDALKKMTDIRNNYINAKLSNSIR